MQNQRPKTKDQIPLFVSQRHQRIDFRCPPRRYITSDERDQHEQCRDAANVNGSLAVTPNSKVDITLVKAIAPTMPIPTPITTRVMPCRPPTSERPHVARPGPCAHQSHACVARLNTTSRHRFRWKQAPGRQKQTRPAERCDSADPRQTSPSTRPSFSPSRSVDPDHAHRCAVRHRSCLSAGCAPAATRSATADRGSRPVTSDSPTRTASAPARAYSMTSCGPRTPDSATRTTLLGMCGSDVREDAALDLEGAQVAGVDADDLGPASTARATSSMVWHSTSGVRPSDLARSTRETSAFWSRAATMSSARSAPCTRASQSW